MKRNFLELLVAIDKNNDYEAAMFVDYIMKKYLGSDDIFSNISSAIPLIEDSDLKDLLEIIERNK
jgi:hypothetical protein